MKIKKHQFSIKNFNPVISVAKDGTVLYSNEAGKPLLQEWKVAVGEKLPSNIGDIVQRVISQHSPIKIEVKVGKKVYLTTFYHFIEDKCVNIYGFEKSDQKELEEKVQESKAKEVENLELSEVVDVQAIQSLMDDFYKLANIPMSLDDIKGNVLVGVGWQDICSKFHRVHPDTSRHCIESSIRLSVGIPPGEFKLFKCKNNMWDMATPIIVGGHHVGNIFSGQFFFDDEPLDYELFQSQARQYGFNEDEYIAALEKVPRMSRESVKTGVSYLMKLANMISQLSYSNTMFAQSLAERDTLVDALRESEKREKARSEELAAVLDAAPAAVMIAHDPMAIKMTGNQLSHEWIRLPEGANISKVFPEGKRPETHKLFKDGVEISLEDMPLRIAASGKEVLDYELDVVYPEGTMRHVLCNARPLRDEQGNPRGAVAALIDITDRKQAEKALQESEMHFRTLAVNSPDIITRFDRRYRHIYVNPAGEISYGFPLFELIGKTQGDLGRDTKNVKFWEENLESVFATGKTKTIEYHISIEGKKYYFNTKIEPEFVDDKVVSVLTISRDITEIKESEAKLKETLHNLDKLVIKRTKELQKAYNSLKESERSLAEAQKMAHLGNWDWNLISGEMYWSEEMYRIFGRTPQKFGSFYSEFLSCTHPDDREHVDNAVKRALKGDSFAIDYRLVLASGEERTVHAQGKVVFDEENTPIRIRGTVQDITEHKKSEEEIRNLANIVESSNDVIGTITLDGIFTSWNKGAEQVYGYSQEEILGKSTSILAPPHLREETKKISERIKQGESIHHYETLRRRKDGKIINVSRTLSPVFDSHGKMTAISFISRDITENKKSEEKIRNLANIVESSNDAIGTISLEGIITSWNKGAEQIYGYSVKEILGTPVSIVAPAHLGDETKKISERVKQGESIHQYETFRLRKDGKIINVSITLSPVFDSNGKMTDISFISRDITEKKTIEEKLRESEEKYRNIIETANEGIYTVDAEAKITYVNSKLMKMLGYSLEECICRPICDFICEEDQIIVKLNLEKRWQGIDEVNEFKLKRKDGSYLWTLVSAKPLFEKDGKFMGAVCMLTDITSRKEAEQTLANFEVAREKEIHHRIKNNLQVVSSLLDFHAFKFKGRNDIKDSEVIDSFRECKNRVISMALIHEELYRGSGLETINFSAYAEKLVNNLLLIYRLGNTDITLNKDMEKDLFFDMDTAIPLGTMINELVSNSLKHAFRGRDKGEIQIKIHREEDNREYIKDITENYKSTTLVLTVSDNGVGIPEKLDIEKLDSLGLQLVTTLVNKLGGELELKSNNGTKFIIRFIVTEKSK